LIAPLPDRLTGFIIELYRLDLLRNDRHGNFGDRILVGYGGTRTSCSFP